MKSETFHHGIKPVHSTVTQIMKCMAYATYHFIKTHSGKSVRMKSETFHYGIKSVHSTASDYEMHETYDAFSYSKM